MTLSSRGTKGSVRSSLGFLLMAMGVPRAFLEISSGSGSAEEAEERRLVRRFPSILVPSEMSLDSTFSKDLQGKALEAIQKLTQAVLLRMF